MIKSNIIKIGKKAQKGMTLIELIVVIAIFAIILGLGIKYVPPMLDSLKASKLQSDVNAMFNLARRTAPNGDYSQVTTATILGSKILEEFHNSAGTSIIGATGSPVLFASADVGAGTDNGLAQTHSDATDRVCVLFVNDHWSSTSLLSINGVAVKTAPTMALNTAGINANCSTGANTLIVTMQ